LKLSCIVQDFESLHQCLSVWISRPWSVRDSRENARRMWQSPIFLECQCDGRPAAERAVPHAPHASP
jgi:hypothetical protein